MNRRKFLTAAAATGAATAFTARSYASILGANDRVNLGVIGLGRRATAVTGGFVKDPRVKLAALCDVYGAQTTQFQKHFAANLSSPLISVRYQELLSNKDIDSVFIATPDHLHVQLGSDALDAGKNVYLEKPTVHDWKSRHRLEKAAAASKRVLQCGTQQRSGDHYAQAKQEFFDSGKLGSVVLVRAIWNNFPWQRRDVPPAPKPDDLNWDLFLGPAPKVPYEYVRYTSWRSFPDYGSGVLADILTHWVDVAQWMLNDDKPKRASSLGGIYNLHQNRENPDTVSAIVQYDKWNLSFESSVLSIRDDHPAVLFEGTNGLLNLTRGGYTYTPNEGDPVNFKSTQNLEVAHTKNFLDAVITGSKPSAPLSAGLSATLPVEMSLKSYWSQKVVSQADLD